MSKDGRRTHTVQLSSDGILHTLIIDGIDFSLSARSAQLTLGTGELPSLTIDPIIFRLDEVDLEAVRVVIPERTAERLIALGWTPPSDSEAQASARNRD